MSLTPEEREELEHDAQSNNYQREYYNKQDPEWKKQRNAQAYARLKERGVLETKKQYTSEWRKKRIAQGQLRAGRIIKNQEEWAPRPRPTTCDVCNRTGRIMFDHCHNSNLFRGWLCHGCNVTLGLLDEDPETLEKLAAYIRKHR